MAGLGMAPLPTAEQQGIAKIQSKSRNHSDCTVMRKRNQRQYRERVQRMLDRDTVMELVIITYKNS